MDQMFKNKQLLMELEKYYVSYINDMNIKNVSSHQKFYHISDAILSISKHMAEMKNSFCPTIFKDVNSTLKSLIQTQSDRDTRRKSDQDEVDQLKQQIES